MSQDKFDANLDLNLRSIGRALAAPATPTGEQRRFWKYSATTPPALSLNRSAGGYGGPQRSHRGWLTLGWASAAAFLLGAVLLVPMRGSIVEAATIFRSLRDSVHRGFSGELSHIRVPDENLDVDGRMLVTFAEPISLARLIEDEDGAPEPQLDQLYADLAIKAGPNNPDITGLDARLVLAISRGQTWAFVRVQGFPADLMHEAPFLVFFESMLRTGVVFDLTGLVNEDLYGAGGADEGDSGAGNGSLTVSANSNGFDIHIGDEEKPGDDQESDNPQLEALVKSILTGHAGRAELAQVQDALNGSAGQVTVREVESGLWELTATDLQIEPDDEEIDLSNATLVIRYREGAGVESAAVEHVGEQGSLRFGFIDDPIDAALLNRQRFLDEGAQLIDLAAIAKMFESFGGGPNDPD